MDGLLEALKWILIVLLAGFIGQFGKSLSTHILDYFKKRKLRHAAGTAAEPLGPAGSDPAGSGAGQPVIADKKALKAQAKAQKKAQKG
ncbi:MAG: hypothetical protein NTV89_11575 [Proteobacteria bacterium]|nr:hypothetical protein [Pseudomonadota bacterium]